jgi:hypothetical protein
MEMGYPDGFLCVDWCGQANIDKQDKQDDVWKWGILMVFVYG